MCVAIYLYIHIFLLVCMSWHIYKGKLGMMKQVLGAAALDEKWVRPAGKVDTNRV